MQEDMQERQRRAERIEALIQQVSEFTDPYVRATTEELLQSLLDLYGEGLTHILELTVQTGASSYKLIDHFVNDELVGSLLLLHDLHPVDIETRIAQALDSVRPYLQSHGGNVELIGIQDGVVHLRLAGSCQGCPSSLMTLKLTIEEAIKSAAPDLVAIEVEGLTDQQPARTGTPVTFVPRQRKESAHASSQQIAESEGWQIVDDLAELPVGTLKAMTVAGESLIFSLLGDTYYAYYNKCSSCQMPLETAELQGTLLTCASCGQQYDIHHAGRGLNTTKFFLEPVPLLVEDGKVKVVLPDRAVLSAS